MKYQSLFLFYLFSEIVLYTSICPVLWGAPTTAKIVFASRKDGNLDIYTMNPDGRDPTRLTQHHSVDANPKWSPTGEHIIFSSDRDGVLDLYLMRADGANIQRFFLKSAARGSATWSPDGTWIAYDRWEHGKFSIYIASTHSRKEEQVAIGSQPTWSPDGTEIAFIEGAPREPKRISILNVHTRRHKFFFPLKVPSWVRYPAWSPTGSELAFSWLNRVEFRREDFEAETIYIVNRDGTALQQILAEAGPPAVNPVWSYGGNALLYERPDAENQFQIFKISLNGNPPVQLTEPGLSHFLGDWFDPEFALPVSLQPQLLTTTWAEIKKK
ncbi:MAG: hypothetical protein OXG97_10730 [Candidatus Poribacteria bacterium]|nr:hypothetical protein [Candidatus Poribacteria bacterium]